jgi:hypothetical protein
VKPKTTLHKFGWIILALVGMTLWAAMALADDALEIGKTYVIRDNTKGALSYQFTKVPLKRGEAITLMERIAGDDPDPRMALYVIQRQSGETIQVRAFVLEEALKENLIALPKEPRPPFRSTINYGSNEPEGYKDFKFGMTYEETQILAEEKGLNLLYDSIGPVAVSVHLQFLPDNGNPESKLSSVFLSFDSGSYETLKEIFIKRYGKPTSLQRQPYKTQGGLQSTNEILSWRGPHSFIELNRHGSHISHGFVTMGTNESLRGFSKKRAEEIKDAAKGL